MESCIQCRDRHTVCMGDRRQQRCFRLFLGIMVYKEPLSRNRSESPALDCRSSVLYAVFRSRREIHALSLYGGELRAVAQQQRLQYRHRDRATDLSRLVRFQWQLPEFLNIKFMLQEDTNERPLCNRPPPGDVFQADLFFLSVLPLPRGLHLCRLPIVSDMDDRLCLQGIGRRTIPEKILRLQELHEENQIQIHSEDLLSLL